MGYQIIFENNGQGVVLALSGDIEGEEILQAAREMYLQDDKHQLRYQIVDFLAVGNMEISEQQLREIAHLDQQAAGHSPNQVVALVGRNEIFVGSDIRYAIYAQVWAGFKSEVFRTQKEARAWIAQEVPEASDNLKTHSNPIYFT